jgi:serine/threonine-protein kinase
MPPTNQLQSVGGRYRVGERVGHGGMGEVFAAHDERLDREVALKLLRADLLDQDGMRERVLAEARLAARLTHPHVVAVLDTGEEEGRPYVVMERLSGRTLRDELARGPLPEERVRDVGLQVLRALEAAHELGIVHRDMKPGNVLDAGVGTWKVADFGIAKWVHADETLTGTGELLGSPSYLAPERIEGREAGPASDLYAVGVLLYEALCGRRPYSATDPISLATRIAEGAFEPVRTVRPDAAPELVAVIERAMQRDPAQRFADAKGMARALAVTDRTADGTPTEVSRVTTPPDGDGAADGDATETVAMPALERTARLPAQPAAAPAAAPPQDPGDTRLETEPGAAARVRPAAGRRWTIVAAAIVAIVLVTVLALVAFSGSDRPQGARDGARVNVPAELEDALQQLEESVRP